MLKLLFITGMFALLSFSGASCLENHPAIEVIERTTIPAKVGLYWKNEKGETYGNFPSLFDANKNLAYACNAGMYDGTPDRQPVGLYIENGKKLRPLKKVNNDKVNFGMQPQGVFFITKAGVARVLAVEGYEKEKESDVRCATQSAPMLVIDGKVNSKLTKSTSTYTRNGVGILKNGHVLLLFAKTPVTFQQFAKLFVEKGCTSALYLDGAISNLIDRTSDAYNPRIQYGPFIGVTK
jgi:uncharacterized protein YigE (DUF2233 family)